MKTTLPVRLLCGVSAAVLLASCAQAATVTVATPAALTAALVTAQGGDVIELAAGSYGDLAFSGMHFSGPGVTITSADTTHPATVSSLSVWGLSSGINLDHLTVQVPQTEQYGVQVDGASNLNFSNLTITGTGTVGAYNGTGILVRGGTGVSITHSDVSQVNVGISVVDSNNVTVSNNAVHDLSQDGIDSAGSTNEVIQGNSFTNFSPGDGVHPDAIQFFADGNGVADSNILVKDNVITRGTGGVFQGVFVENTNHIEITGNAMAGTMYNGISLSTTDTALVSNNFVEGFSDMTSWIVTRNVSSNVSVTNNEATSFQNVADGGVANPNYVESASTVIAQANVGDYTALNAWLAQHIPSTASLSDSFFTGPIPAPTPAPAVPAPDPLQPALDAASAQIAADKAAQAALATQLQTATAAQQASATALAAAQAQVTTLTAQVAADKTQAATLTAQLATAQATGPAAQLKTAQSQLATANATIAAIKKAGGWK